MANTIATAVGHDNGRDKRTTRLGAQSATGMAATWHTSAEAHVRKDGSGHFSLVRDGSTIITLHFGPEGVEEQWEVARLSTRASVRIEREESQHAAS